MRLALLVTAGHGSCHLNVSSSCAMNFALKNAIPEPDQGSRQRPGQALSVSAARLG
jgi:hypothetical protein